MLPLGEVDPAHVRFTCEAIRQTHHLQCVALRPHPLPSKALDRRRFQYDADIIVEGLFERLPGDGAGLLAITNSDLFEAGKSHFVFGLASLVDRVGIVSLARYRGAWWGEQENPARFYERAYKVIIHEVSHTLGLGHCPNPHCAMREDATLEALDDSPRRFCKRCQAALERNAKPEPGRWHYLRGHSHLNRAQLSQAVFHFERAAEIHPDDPRVLNDLGVAYLRRGDPSRALWCFRRAEDIAPRFPNARYNEGLIFLAAQDPKEAKVAFERALEVDPEWSLAHRQLGELYQSEGRPERALAHFEAYLRRHQDEAVEAQVKMIKGGGEAPLP
ncbi:tetratricopeptide repeat protein [Myxococcota bacterium]|nr:tetratricopeptide repeat protein [Myxococcota bacterium]MBU1430822.1 tetratricopeptide repeat protein [Myxococcota bacterium]MBU1899652.1 tetratricopeptide repeat protein [Myxococcota bacterium]